jgi:hypothetical protein
MSVVYTRELESRRLLEIYSRCGEWRLMIEKERGNNVGVGESCGDQLRSWSISWRHMWAELDTSSYGSSSVVRETTLDTYGLGSLAIRNAQLKYALFGEM